MKWTYEREYTQRPLSGLSETKYTAYCDSFAKHQTENVQYQTKEKEYYHFLTKFLKYQTFLKLTEYRNRAFRHHKLSMQNLGLLKRASIENKSQSHLKQFLSYDKDFIKEL